MTRDECINIIKSINRKCKGPQKQGCGYDFNETIIKGAWDGIVYNYVCPKCGLTGDYKSPRFEVES